MDKKIKTLELSEKKKKVMVMSSQKKKNIWQKTM